MVVAIIAVLAIVVVPNFLRETHKSKGRAEVNAVATEIANKLGTYYTENHTYEVGTSLVNGTAATCGTTGTTGYEWSSTLTTACAVTEPWATLRILPANNKLYCSYSLNVGSKGDTLTVPAPFKTSQGGTGAEPAIAGSWWYLVATCDEDGQGGVNATYYVSSVDSKLQAANEAK